MLKDVLKLIQMLDIGFAYVRIWYQYMILLNKLQPWILGSIFFLPEECSETSWSHGSFYSVQEASKAGQSQDWNIDAVEVIPLEITLKRWVNRLRHRKSQCFFVFLYVGIPKR